MSPKLWKNLQVHQLVVRTLEARMWTNEEIRVQVLFENFRHEIKMDNACRHGA